MNNLFETFSDAFRSKIFKQFLAVSAVFAVVILGSLPTIREARQEEKNNGYSERFKIEEATVERNWQLASAHPEKLDAFLAAADDMASMKLRTSKYSEAVDLYQKEMGATWSLVSNAYNDRWVRADIKAGGAHRDNGDFKTALVCYQSALDHDQKYLPTDDLRIARDYDNIGLMHYMLGLAQAETKNRNPEFQLAIDNYKKTLAMAQKSGKKPLEATALWNLSLASRDMGDKQTAAQYEKEARAIDVSMHRICTAP